VADSKKLTEGQNYFMSGEWPSTAVRFISESAKGCLTRRISDGRVAFVERLVLHETRHAADEQTIKDLEARLANFRERADELVLEIEHVKANKGLS